MLLAPTQPVPANLVLDCSATAAKVFGTLFIELIAPTPARLPDLPGWQLRAWPQARLGDLTLEARPLRAATPDELLGALRAAGFTPLGQPVRR